jgi:ABC-2 type transport system permease protein
MQSAVVSIPPVAIQVGIPEWLSGYRSMIRWHWVSLRLWLSILATVEILAGAGFVLGIALLFGRVPASAALFVSTGVPVINLVLIGLVLGPQLVADQKLQHTYEFLRTLPIPQTAAAAAWYTVCLAASLPGVVVALTVAEIRFGIPLRVSPTVVPAVLLTAFTGTMLGYGLGHAIVNPMVTRLTTQALIFAMFGFTPIAFPAGQLPGWLAGLNAWLPFGHMADIVRAGLTSGVASGVTSSYLIVAAWGAVGVFASAWALGRRR